MNSPLVITGAFGFVGSTLLEALNKRGIVPYVLIRSLNANWQNVRGLKYRLIQFADLDNVSMFPTPPTVVHLGANVSTLEDMSLALWDNNVNFPLRLRAKAGRFLYASSGATYGSQETPLVESLDVKPLNAYAYTKLYLDQMLKDDNAAWGFRFTNVYGPREVFKGDMMSLPTRAILKKEPLYLEKGTLVKDGPHTVAPLRKAVWSIFRTHRSDIKDGNQARDFVHADDVVSVLLHFLDKLDIPAGVYNVGSGVATTFNDLVKTVDSTIPIEYEDMPAKLRPQYQYRTQASLTKLREIAGYDKPFISLKEGVDRTRAWLKQESYLN